VDVSEPASISMGIAARYAQAVFDLSREGGDLDKLETDVRDLNAAIEGSPELRDLLGSPVVSRGDQGRAIAAVGEKMGLSATMVNTLRLMASKRRLFVVPQMLRALRERIDAEKGEMTAEVRAAKPLSAEQEARLKAALGESSGRDVTLDVTVDEALIGGLVVKLGSRMVDGSVRARLDALRNTMREVR
jgi:F-type H+-transporting ATPase subunit delta